MRIFRGLIGVLCVTSLLCVASQAAAPPRRGVRAIPRPAPRPAPRRVVVHPPRGARRVVVTGVPYWIHGGIYYRLEHDGYVVVSAPVIRVLPRHHRVVVVRGMAYYIVDGVYYRSTPGGYAVVETPPTTVEVISRAPEAVAPRSSTYTLYVPKRTGEGHVSVTLRKLEGGFLGPQGEFYPTMPQVVLLTEMYGIPEELRQVRSDAFFIHVPNADGESFTRVTLTRRDRGFVGPQGEFYPLMPTVAHLAELYGAGQAPAEVEEVEIRIQVPKKNGEGSVEVVLTKQEQGYLGPQGEFYPELPSADHLIQVYGGD
jgi:Family of unknown function (DUF6515)